MSFECCYNWQRGNCSPAINKRFVPEHTDRETKKVRKARWVFLCDGCFVRLIKKEKWLRENIHPVLGVLIIGLLLLSSAGCSRADDFNLSLSASGDGGDGSPAVMKLFVHTPDGDMSANMRMTQDSMNLQISGPNRKHEDSNKGLYRSDGTVVSPLPKTERCK